jgi:hypothetical protein
VRGGGRRGVQRWCAHRDPPSTPPRAAGTWISYNDIPSLLEIVAYAQANNLRGTFLFDASMDTLVDGTFTYNVTNTVADAMGA